MVPAHLIPQDDPWLAAVRTHVLAGAELHYERMSGAFEKWHVPGLDRPASFHRFTQPDRGDPHDHPWSFTTHILSGGYDEEVFSIGPNNSWRSEVHHRAPGTAHTVSARHIHRIVHLPEGEAWTLVLAGPHERTSRFWRFRQRGIWSRAWHQRRFTRRSVGQRRLQL